MSSVGNLAVKLTVVPDVQRLPLHAAADVAVIGLGYVGLPTAVALAQRGAQVVGIDISRSRLEAIRELRVDAPESERDLIQQSLSEGSLYLTSESRMSGRARAVVIAVPTPVDSHLVPDLEPLRAACASAVAHAEPGQAIVLTSTSYVGTTRDLLVRPLEARGFTVGEDIFVAFSPERIDPGNTTHGQHAVPRVVGGVTSRCTERAAAVLEGIAASIHRVESPEVAELTKLYENTFRAVNIAFVNEMAEVSRNLGLDIMDVIAAASTKPYGFMPFYPGPGVGGHCIPCDPHYLLWQLRSARVAAPLIDQAMTSIARRPGAVVARAIELLSESTRQLRGARILVAGIAYKPGIADVRESPAMEIIEELRDRGAHVEYFDPWVPSVLLHDRTRLTSTEPGDGEYDLAIVHTLHPNVDYSWLSDCGLILDATYRLDIAAPVATV